MWGQIYNVMMNSYCCNIFELPSYVTLCMTNVNAHLYNQTSTYFFYNGRNEWNPQHETTNKGPLIFPSIHKTTIISLKHTDVFLLLSEISCVVWIEIWCVVVMLLFLYTNIIYPVYRSTNMNILYVGLLEWLHLYEVEEVGKFQSLHANNWKKLGRLGRLTNTLSFQKFRVVMKL